WRLALGVHQHAMPAIQHDGLVVGMPHATTDIGRSTSLHSIPEPFPCGWFGVQQRSIFAGGQSSRVKPANVHKFSARSVQELTHVWFAATATDWFISQD